MCCSGDCVCMCMYVCVSVGWAIGAGWKSSFSLGTFHPESPGSRRWPATEAQRTSALEDAQGTPCQAWHPNNCLIRNYGASFSWSAVFCSALPPPIFLSLSKSLFPSPNFLVFSFFFFVWFSQATPSACPMGNMWLDLVPLWLMLCRRHERERGSNTLLT